MSPFRKLKCRDVHRAGAVCIAIRSLASLLPPAAEGGCARRRSISARPLWYRSRCSTYPTGVGGSPAAPRSQTGLRLIRLITAVLVLLPLVMTAARLPAFGNVDKSIAVLPFVNRSGSHENTRFFPAGFHADLLTALTNIQELRVTARYSVMSYRDTTKNMHEIGAELGVNKLLEGSVQFTTGRVHIQVRLIDALTGKPLWA